ncbi:MAG TPA: hypothetical protein VLF79_02800 [Candidatus Saccharimonadales bacterium]|nr:hypothetical protein [Candidatus Saccharimonadales bacterium]
MAHPETVTMERADQNPFGQMIDYMGRNAKRGAAVAISGLALAGVYEVGKGGAGNSPDITPPALASSGGTSEACLNYTPEDLTTNASNYLPDAFLPKTEINSSETSMQEVNSLFAKDGAITDKHTLAAIMATVVLPSLKGNVGNTNFDYVQAYTDRVAAYDQDSELAGRDCNIAADVLVQVAGYNSAWNKPGAPVSKFEANRDNSSYEITSAALTAPKTVLQTLSGTEFKLRDTTKGVNGEQLQGFPSVLVTPDGEIFLQGLTPSQAGKSPVEHGKHPQHVTIKRLPNGQIVVHATGGGTNKNFNNGGGGTSGTSNGTSRSHAESPKRGQKPENQAGPRPGRNHGQGGQGTKTGPSPSPNGGGNETSTPAPSRPTETTTTSTPPPTETTTTSTPPPPKGDEPTCTPTKYTPCP